MRATADWATEATATSSSNGDDDDGNVEARVADMVAPVPLELTMPPPLEPTMPKRVNCAVQGFAIESVAAWSDEQADTILCCDCLQPCKDLRMLSKVAMNEVSMHEMRVHASAPLPLRRPRSS